MTSENTAYMSCTAPAFAPSGAVKPGLYHCVDHGCEILFSEFSLVVIYAGTCHSATEFTYNSRNHHVVAVAQNWALDFYFSPNLSAIERGTCSNLVKSKTFTFGYAPGSLIYKRREERQFQRSDSLPGKDPALYRLNDDHVALIVCEHTFVVLMKGDVYKSSSFIYNPKTRHVTAKAHIWAFDFFFSEDFYYIERGSYRVAPTGKVWNFGTAPGQLFFQREIYGET